MPFATGAVAPSFALPDQHGATVRLADFRGRRPVCLVFFPFAFSRTCHGELCELRDNFDLFAAPNVELLAISVDAKYALRAWSEQEGYGFRMLSDFWPHGEVSKAYDAFDESEGFSTRVTYLIDKAGVTRSSFASSAGEPRPLAKYREALASL